MHQLQQKKTKNYEVYGVHELQRQMQNDRSSPLSVYIYAEYIFIFMRGGVHESDPRILSLDPFRDA
jgi:hypothetical protein